MDIKTFQVEEWMNAYEHEAVYNIAETCCDSFTVEELIALDGTSPDAFFRGLSGMKLTYGHIEGSPEFRKAVSDLYAAHIGPENVLMMNGAIGANYLVFYTLIRPGDEVIAVHPTYQQLYSAPESLGANVKLWRLREQNGFLPNLDELREMVSEKTRLICINNPNNPTGAVMDRTFLEEVASIARSVGAYVLSDEVYRGLWQDDDISIPSMADIYEKAISTGSMSKVYSLAGLRLGWIVGPTDVIKECFRHRDYTTISCGMLDDRLAVHALTNHTKVLERNRALVKRNLQILDDWVNAEPLVSYVKPQAGTTALLKYHLPISSHDFCLNLFRQTGAFLTPGSCFDFEGHVRIGYACGSDVLQEGLRHVSEFIAAEAFALEIPSR